MSLEVFVDNRPFNPGLDFHVIDRGGGVTFAAQPLTMVGVNESTHHQPTFHLGWTQAQALMDALYAAGLRPAEARYANDALKATQEHIADLRTIAMKLVDFITTDTLPLEPQMGGVLSANEAREEVGLAND